MVGFRSSAVGSRFSAVYPHRKSIRPSTWTFTSIICIACLTAAPSAFADTGDINFGLGASYASPKEARVDARAQYGLSQFLSLRGSAGAGFADEGTRALLSAGVVYAYDVITWVPEFGVYGGVSLGDGYHHGRVLALAGLRRYVSRTSWVALSAGAEYDWALRDGDHWHGLIDLAFWL